MKSRETVVTPELFGFTSPGQQTVPQDERVAGEAHGRGVSGVVLVLVCLVPVRDHGCLSKS